MKRWNSKRMVGVVLATATIWIATAAANAGNAPTTQAAPAKAGRVVTAKGVQNSRKVMLHTKERYQRVNEVKKRERALKEKARRTPS